MEANFKVHKPFANANVIFACWMENKADGSFVLADGTLANYEEIVKGFLNPARVGLRVVQPELSILKWLKDAQSKVAETLATTLKEQKFPHAVHLDAITIDANTVRAAITIRPKVLKS